MEYFILIGMKLIDSILLNSEFLEIEKLVGIVVELLKLIEMILNLKKLLRKIIGSFFFFLRYLKNCFLKIQSELCQNFYKICGKIKWVKNFI